MSEKYTDDLVYDTYHAPAHLTAYCIPPAGYLLAILIGKRGGGPDLKFRLGDYGADVGDTPIAEFTVAGVLMCGGIMLPEPIPNLNSACPWVLRTDDDVPELDIITVNRRMA